MILESKLLYFFFYGLDCKLEWSKFSEFGTVELYVLEASNWNIGNLRPDITKSVIINEVKIPQNLGEMMCITIFLCLLLF